ncbi:lipid kinase [Allosaccharopolyspora coralli]|uniref:Lipid kinase n=1 Tax=Allosaccharopolyspora coralli TaxID=2665642 RepID=A0A5Q3QLA5_9PSEU|nr:lipid kinase [Allosaccharopolyspora coralli]
MTRAATKAALIVNVHSRTGARACDHAEQRLRELDVPLGAVHRLHDASRLPETVAGAVDGGHDLIVLGGGDGSVSSVVDELAHREVPLGLLPLGTANDFARTMHIPTDLDAACRTIAESHIVDIDLGLCGNNYYVNRASIGLGARVSEAMSPFLKRRVGPLAYPVATAKALSRHRPFTATLSFPDGDHEDQTFPGLLQVGVANGRYFGGGQIAGQDAGIDDSTLDVSVIRQGGPRDLLAVARELRRGSTTDTAQISHFRTRAVHVHTPTALSINVDGEVVASTPREFSVARNALHVLTPETWSDGS